MGSVKINRYRTPHLTCYSFKTNIVVDRLIGTVARPRLRNNLPVELRQQDISFGQFKRGMKRFCLAETTAHCDFLFISISALFYLFTYLQTVYPAYHTEEAGVAWWLRQWSVSRET